MVFSVGAGVGLAAVLGTLRFVKNWPLKPIVFASLLPTVAASCYCQWGNPHLKPLLGVAWDLGGGAALRCAAVRCATASTSFVAQRQKRLVALFFAVALHFAAPDSNCAALLDGSLLSLALPPASDHGARHCAHPAGPGHRRHAHQQAAAARSRGPA
jgi:hypothetical protein